MKQKSFGKASILSSLFAALICAAAFIQIPLPGGVPIVIQDMTAILSGMLLGPFFGSLAVLLFLLVGIIGLPVFSGKAGFHVISQGLTGGFLIGYLLAAFLSGLFMYFFYTKEYENKEKKFAPWIILSLSALIGTLVLFALGIARFMALSGKPFSQTFSLVLIPLIPGTVIKLFVLTIVTKNTHKLVQQIIR